MDKLEKISQTDIACAWSQQKANTQQKYKAVSIKEMPCFKQCSTSSNLNIDNALVEQIKYNLIEALPHSALTLHKYVFIKVC